MLSLHSKTWSRSYAVGARSRRAMRGLSIIELMIGVAIGLFVVAGGAKLLADGLIGNRRTVVEARIAQDLRAAADIIARDLRRAGYWDNSTSGVTGTPALNVYAPVSPGPSAVPAHAVTYSYDKDGSNTLDSAENLGFQLVTANGVGRLQMQLGANNWQDLTDPRTVNVTTFDVRPVTAEISLGNRCLGNVAGTTYQACCQPHVSNPAECKPDIFERRGSNYAPTNGVTPAAGVIIRSACPQLIVRSFDIEIVGQGLPPNTNARSVIRESVRVRNDQVTSVGCPT